MPANAPPRAKDPVSPMNTFAGLILNTKKPRHTAVTMDPKKATLSAATELSVEYIIKPITENAIAATADVPDAKPSRPSVRLTALVAPTMIKKAKI